MATNFSTSVAASKTRVVPVLDRRNAGGALPNTSVPKAAERILRHRVAAQSGRPCPERGSERTIPETLAAPMSTNGARDDSLERVELPLDGTPNCLDLIRIPVQRTFCDRLPRQPV